MAAFALHALHASKKQTMNAIAVTHLNCALCSGDRMHKCTYASTFEVLHIACAGKGVKYTFFCWFAPFLKCSRNKMVSCVKCDVVTGPIELIEVTWFPTMTRHTRLHVIRIFLV